MVGANRSNASQVGTQRDTHTTSTQTHTQHAYETMKNEPQSESATAAFQVDESVRLLPQICPHDSGHSHVGQHSEDEGGLFGVVLVANWPPKESLMKPYKEFVVQIKEQEWFEKIDLEQQKGSEEKNCIPAVYFYPPQALHITIATFKAFNAPEVKHRDDYANACRRIVHKSFARKDWPSGPFQIEIDRVHIGTKAGILLWENPDGAIASMREIMREEYDAYYKVNPGALDHRDLKVPNIIHTTFIRFAHSPKSSRAAVSERFLKASINPKNMFGKISVDSVRLAIERIPYMHIPCNERHVLASSLEPLLNIAMENT